MDDHEEQDVLLLTDKATYRTDEQVRLLYTASGQAITTGELSISISTLGRELLKRTIHPSEVAASQGSDQTTIDLGVFPPGGYEVLLMEVLADSGQNTEGRILAATAFDVSAGAPEVVRYGFMSDFAPCNPEERSRQAVLASRTAARFHMTHIQFYDWMYRHHELVPPTTIFKDALGRTVDLDALRERIAACRGLGMIPIAYGAVYGAEKEFADTHQELILERSDGSKLDFIGIISICDITPASAWCDHLVGEYERAVRELGFGGIHMDQYGAPKLALRADGSLVDVASCFKPLVERTKEALSAMGKENFVVFNCVNAWPPDFLSGARQDATYIEVWDPWSRYRHLAELARKARLLAPGRPVVLAAYLKCFLDPAETDERREASLRLAMAVICANGATQLLLGEADGVLAEGYYVNHGHWRPSFESVLCSYTDFIVKYRDLLFGAQVRDESLSFAGGINDEFRITGAPWSVEYESGTVCASVARVGPDSVVVNLVNLSGIGDERWTTGKAVPTPVEGLGLELIAWGDVEEVLCASPDDGLGRFESLAWEYANHPQGRGVRIAVPELHWWSLVLVRFRGCRGSK